MADRTRFKELDKRIDSHDKKLEGISEKLDVGEVRMENMERSMEELKLMILELQGNFDQLRKEKQTMEVPPVSQTHSDSNSSLNDNGGGMLQQLTQNASPVVSQMQCH